MISGFVLPLEKRFFNFGSQSGSAKLASKSRITVDYRNFYSYSAKKLFGILEAPVKVGYQLNLIVIF